VGAEGVGENRGGKNGVREAREGRGGNRIRGVGVGRLVYKVGVVGWGGRCKGWR